MRYFLISAISLFALSGCGGVPSSGGEKMEFSLPGLDGEIYTLSDFNGKVYIIDFWATWCGPCRLSIPFLKRLYGELRDKGLVVIGIGLDSEPALRSFAEQMEIDYPVLVGTREIAIRYKIRGIPTMFIVDKKGKIIDRVVGYAPSVEGKIKNRVLELLE